MIGFWLVIVSATLATFFFTATNHALFDFSRSRLQEILGEGRADRLDRLDARRDALLLVTSLLRTAANLTIFVAMLWFFRAEAHADWWKGTMLALACAAGIVAVLGVAVPLSWARHSAEPLLAHTLPVLLAVAALMHPMLLLLHGFDPLVRRLLGVPIPGAQDSSPIEQEIMDAVSEGRKSGFVDDTQKRMFEAVVVFPTTTVDQVMTPRTDIEGIPVSATLAEIKRMISEAGHSRVPVYDGDLDHIVGVLYAKDLIPLLGKADSVEPFDLRKIVRPAVLVPETKSLNDLLKQLREMKVHIAIVVDEYGGTAGLVTIEDIVEEVFGEIRDEYEPADEEAPKVERVTESAWLAHGRVYIHDLNVALGVELPDEEDYDTLAGFVLAKLGHIPSPGESFEHEGWTFTVEEAERTRVIRVRIESHAHAPSGE